MITRVRILHPGPEPRRVSVVDLSNSQFCELMGEEFWNLSRPERLAFYANGSYVRPDGTDIKHIREGA